LEKTDVLIIGAGLAGLSAARHLQRPYIILEKEETPGGFCRSVQADGSIYDYTGHLLHLRRPEIIGLVNEILPERLMRVERKAGIFTKGRFLPYPFQANFYPLPKDVVKECLLGFIYARELETPDPENFGEWALATLGEGICRHFMFPYNEKLYCRRAEEMTADWVSWSVPQPDLETVIDGALGITIHGLGYNPSFLYPKSGGIEALPQALAAGIKDIRFGREVVAVDPVERVVKTSSGEEYGYEVLVSTMPLPGLLNGIKHPDSRLPQWAGGLRWVNVFNLNLTLRRRAPWDWHWLYLPDREFRCYRVGAASNISPAIAPPGCCSIYTEVSFRPEEKPAAAAVRSEIFEDLRRLDLLDDEKDILNEAVLLIEPAYVIHDRFRAGNLEKIHRWLAENSIHSIGRWGRWEYSAMEDAIWQGRDVAQKVSP
jgi:protoporphyrinogen oxidase